MDDKLQEIIDLEKAGYRATAVRRLRDYLHQEPKNAEAWYFLARFATDPYEQKTAIDMALGLRPAYPEAEEFQAVLLEEYPQLKRYSGRRGCLALLVLAVLVVSAVAILVFFLLQDEPQPEVIVVVPTTSLPPTEVPVIIVTNTPALIASPTLEPTPLPLATETPLPLPTLEPTSLPTEAVPGAYIILLAGDLEPSVFETLATTFNQGDVFLQVLDSPANANLLQSEEASLLITRAGDEFEVYGQDFWQVYRNQPDLIALSRWASPWQVKLTTVEMLVGVVGYVTYHPTETITALSPFFDKPAANLDTNQTLLAFMLAYSYQTAGQADKAVTLYDLLTSYVGQQNAAVSANRAYAIAQTGNHEAAITLYTGLLTQHPDPAFIQSNIGDIYWQLSDDPNAAQLAYEEAIRLYPEAARPYVGRGRLLMQQNQYNRALEDFSTALRLDSAYALAYYERARLEMLLNLLDEAAQDIQLAINLQPQISAYYLLQGQILNLQGNWEAAATALETARGHANPEIYVALAQAYFEQGKLDEAIQASNAALSADVNNSAAWLGRGKAYMAQNELGSALNDFDQGLQRDPDNVALLVARCSVHARLGDDGAAAADCDSALALDGANGAALEQRGMIRYRAGDRAGAQADFLEAITYTPAAYEAHYYLGFFALQERRYNEAINYLSRTIELAPFLGKAYAARGVAYRITGAWEFAIADLERAIELVPEDFYSFYELGLAKRFLADQAYEAANNARAQELYAEAAEALLTFLNNSQPQDQFVAEATQNLNYVRNALSVIGGQ